ncbi:RPM1-interacting protein 4 [Eucalyptus grandis]|uniref:RPM1-interacting protein 4 n=1 Tax=Eucalyptus grandis TaxID=71139 RepID=UPI00192ECEC2|nr:RPM1-interacting protein 4 [Eucalyptus grandis]
MALSQQHSHVPKFGNWDSDNIPYTACFENARREKAGVKMNPNDPEENPEMFMLGRGGVDIDNDSQASVAFEHNISEGHRRFNVHRRTPSDQQRDDLQEDSPKVHRRAPSIPKFGAWDETDPRSGEGFTVIFSKVKEEKHNASSKIPVLPPEQIAHSSNHQKRESSSSSRSKICCCLCFGGRE